MNSMTYTYLRSKLISGFLAILIIMFIIINVSCEKEIHSELSKEWQVLSDTVPLGKVTSSTIKLTATIAGYPQFNRLMDYSIELYKIVYETTYKGEPILASGIISYPINLKEAHPIMIVGNGLVFANEDAPSEFDLPKNYSGFEFIASVGYITLLPDMIGFGESKDILYPIHNYEHSSGAMIDFIKAAKEFIRTKKIRTTGKTFLTGYSQGAYIALSTLKRIEENPYLRINIDAAAVGAGGFNLEYLLEYVISKNTYSAPSHLAMLFSSYNIIYDWNRPLTNFFQEPYASEIPELINGNYNREEIDQHLAYSFDSLLNPGFLDKLKNKTDIELLDALHENSVYDWAPRTPLLIIHSIHDDRIPVSDSEATFNTMIENGSTSVNFIPLDAQDHFNSAFDFIKIVFGWFKGMQ